MSKEELLKYLIAEIDLIMHDKDYRFENANSTWYSRESCRDLTNEEVFEELRAELIQLNKETNSEIVELQKQLEEKEKMLEEYKKCNCEECMTDYEKNLNQIIDKYLYENTPLKQQLKSQPAEIIEKIKKMLEGKELIVDGLSCQYICYSKEDIDEIINFILKEYQKGEN